ncbi:uncharacterized protein EDB91DRAFT_1143750 [Suillus paluster]|uniref:uncharacterized protein n=1 Tax=Suillus paluster TaxID=48578 RepID=UPI001B879354|nr:uncharacterized protein EDB91DRAFT_1143750 [Suillus paluster]KAG1735675.1 hypothetical protein EDB91DRAFT_1143750 [Suillus paluster]
MCSLLLTSLDKVKEEISPLKQNRTPSDNDQLVTITQPFSLKVAESAVALNKMAALVEMDLLLLLWPRPRSVQFHISVVYRHADLQGTT